MSHILFVHLHRIKKYTIMYENEDEFVKGQKIKIGLIILGLLIIILL